MKKPLSQLSVDATNHTQEMARLRRGLQSEQVGLKCFTEKISSRLSPEHKKVLDEIREKGVNDINKIQTEAYNRSSIEVCKKLEYHVYYNQVSMKRSWVHQEAAFYTIERIEPTEDEKDYLRNTVNKQQDLLRQLGEKGIQAHQCSEDILYWLSDDSQVYNTTQPNIEENSNNSNNFRQAYDEYTEQTDEPIFFSFQNEILGILNGFFSLDFSDCSLVIKLIFFIFKYVKLLYEFNYFTLILPIVNLLFLIFLLINLFCFIIKHSCLNKISLINIIIPSFFFVFSIFMPLLFFWLLV